MTEKPLVTETTNSRCPMQKGRWAWLLCLIVIMLVMGLFAYGYFTLFKINMGLVHTVTTLKSQITDQQQIVTNLQQSLSALKVAQQKSQDLSQEQEKMIASWQAAQQGNLEKWHVAEAQYLIKLANDQLQFVHDTSLALILIQRADEVLKTVQNANVLEIRKLLAANIASLRALPPIDNSALYLRLVALDHEIAQLPFPVNPLQEQKPFVATVMPADLPWWKVGIERSLQALSQIVVVRRAELNQLPLVLPDEKLFLLQNLHAQIQSTMWAVLNRRADVYLASLNEAAFWIKQYFLQESPLTKSVLENINELNKINLKPPVIDLSGTLQLFDHYFVTP